MAQQELLSPGAAIDARNVTPPGNVFGESFGGPAQMFGNFGRQPAVLRALPAIAMIGILGLSATAYFALQTAAQVPLFQGLPDNDKAAVAGALQSSGIAYTLESGTGSIHVDEDKVHQARIMLAGQGLPKAAPAGDAMIAALPMGSSRALEGETLRAAREADLARTIEAIEAVKTARIHLATPQPSVFVRESADPAASVMLTLQQGRTLSEAQVRAIRHLVAASVPGMTPQQVSIVDQSGALLSQNGIGADGDDRNFQLQVQMEARYREALHALLSPIVGMGNYSVEVHADVRGAESQSTRETYPKDDRALRNEQGNSQPAESTIGAASGIPGATSNQPPQATIVAAKPDSQQISPAASPPVSKFGEAATSYTRSFDVGREISVTHNPRGQLSRLSVAVALRDPKGGKPRTKAEVDAIENLVKGAVGFNLERGDVVAISSRKFAEAEVVITNFWGEPWFMPLLRQVGALFIALLVLLFIGRPMVKMLRNKVAANTERDEALTQQLLEATKGNSLPGTPRAITLEMIEAAPSYEARANLVRSFVRQDSQRAAMVVRKLLEGNGSD